MKEFFRKNLEFKMVATMFFTSEVIIYTLVAPFLGEYNISLELIWQMVFIAVILTFLQYLLYVTRVLQNIKTWIKVIIHYILLLILGYGCAKIFNWFDTKNIKNIIVSISIFTVSFALFTSSIIMYNKLAGDQFNEKLRIYKNSRRKGE
jgi:hypothetical protein